MIAVADEAGVTNSSTTPPCSLAPPSAGPEAGLKALEALGSKQVRDYCYQYSWAMITVKGEGSARSEGLSRVAAVTLQVSIALLPVGVVQAFTFAPSLGQFLNTTVTSNAITVAGMNAAAPISVIGGTYSVNGGAFTSSPGIVNNGDSVRARISSASTIRTQTCATLIVGGASGAYCSTTGSAPISLPQFLRLIVAILLAD